MLLGVASTQVSLFSSVNSYKVGSEQTLPQHKLGCQLSNSQKSVSGVGWSYIVGQGMEIKYPGCRRDGLRLGVEPLIKQLVKWNLNAHSGFQPCYYFLLTSKNKVASSPTTSDIHKHQAILCFPTNVFLCPLEFKTNAVALGVCL